MTLHEAMREVSKTAPKRAMSPAGLASMINHRGLDRRRDGDAVGASQIGARARNYPHLFERHEGSIRLKG